MKLTILIDVPILHRVIHFYSTFLSYLFLNIFHRLSRLPGHFVLQILEVLIHHFNNFRNVLKSYF